jgi:hypothetical protein
MGEAMRKAKPFVWGLVSGIVVATVVGFGAGWVVTAGAKEQAIWTAKTNRLASICAAQATDHWRADGKDPTDLSGWDKREQREALAEQVAGAWRLEERLQRDVMAECGRMLDT